MAGIARSLILRYAQSIYMKKQIISFIILTIAALLIIPFYSELMDPSNSFSYAAKFTLLHFIIPVFILSAIFSKNIVNRAVAPDKGTGFIPGAILFLGAHFLGCCILFFEDIGGETASFGEYFGLFMIVAVSDTIYSILPKILLGGFTGLILFRIFKMHNKKFKGT